MRVKGINYKSLNRTFSFFVLPFNGFVHHELNEEEKENMERILKDAKKYPGSKVYVVCIQGFDFEIEYLNHNKEISFVLNHCTILIRTTIEFKEFLVKINKILDAMGTTDFDLS